MTDKQPEALRLADVFDKEGYAVFTDDMWKAAAELRRLHSVEKAFQQWITKTEWVQKSSQSHELGIHRADVMKQRLDQLLTENQQLRAALDKPQSDQPAMTPIAQRKLDSLLTEGYTISGYSIYHEQKHQHGFVTGAGLVGWWKPEGVEYPQPQGEQEPVAWAISHSMGLEFSSNYPMQKTKEAAEEMSRRHMGAMVVRPLYAAPVRTKDLTDDEIHKAFYSKNTGLINWIRAVIAADREKNNANNNS